MKKLKEYINDSDFEELLPIDDNFGENLEFKDPDGKNIKSYIVRDKEGYREIDLRITSLLGSVGATHYYGKFTSYSLSFTYKEDKNNTSSIGGWSTKEIPYKYTNFGFDLVRPTTKKDLENDERWGRKSYFKLNKGETTNGFWTEKEVVERGKELFKLAFKGKWKLRIDSYSGKYDEIIKL